MLDVRQPDLTGLPQMQPLGNGAAEMPQRSPIPTAGRSLLRSLLHPEAGEEPPLPDCNATQGKSPRAGS
jgi:hypothetical protein